MRLPNGDEFQQSNIEISAIRRQDLTNKMIYSCANRFMKSNKQRLLVKALKSLRPRLGRLTLNVARLVLLSF